MEDMATDEICFIFRSWRSTDCAHHLMQGRSNQNLKINIYLNFHSWFILIIFIRGSILRLIILKCFGQSNFTEVNYMWLKRNVSKPNFYKKSIFRNKASILRKCVEIIHLFNRRETVIIRVIAIFATRKAWHHIRPSCILLISKLFLRVTIRSMWDP